MSALVIEYTLYGEPVPQPRARIARWGGVAKAPERVQEARERHAEAARLAAPDSWPLRARYALHVVCFRKTERKCDGDNLLKLVADAITESGVVWSDDEQVDVWRVEKRRDAKDPRTEVRVWVVSEETVQPKRARRAKGVV